MRHTPHMMPFLSGTQLDQDLLTLLAAGDRDAMKELYGRHQARIYRFVLRIVRNEARAEELVNEVFLAIWQQAGRFEGSSKPTTWMLSIAHNKAVSALRRRTEDAADDATIEEMVDDADSAETRLQKDDVAAILRRCIEKLPEDQRVVMDLVYYQEQSVREVSTILSVPENTVKTRMFYARRKLEVLLKAAGVDRGWP
jgi:RNA polymerase sigma-70 factor, ECF subfamily